uniref:Uncharacterized protein n=1 Tax=Ixodes ricinus TaxID=34613 RepID=A0A6B0U1Z5_IXORI
MARCLCRIPGLWHMLAAFHRGLTAHAHLKLARRQSAIETRKTSPPFSPHQRLKSFFLFFKGLFSWIYPP